MSGCYLQWDLRNVGPKMIPALLLLLQRRENEEKDATFDSLTRNLVAYDVDCMHAVWSSIWIIRRG